MKKIRGSLIYQAQQILSPQFEQGFERPKHKDKKNGTNKSYIYSRSSYNNILEKCCTYLKFCKAKYQLRFIDKLKPEYFNEFIKSGNNGKGYNKETAKTYKHAVKRLEEGFNSIFNRNYTWADASYINSVNKEAEKLRVQMPREIHDEIIKKTYESKNETGLAFDIARNLGLRVSEITNLRIKDFVFDNDGNIQSIYIHRSKGGRSRTIDAKLLSPGQKDIVKKVYVYFRDSRNIDNRLFIYKSDSYQRAFHRVRNLVTGDYKSCGLHSMRKEFAKDYFEREIQKGRNIKEVEKELTQLLGHNRLDILGHYLKS